MNGINKIKLKLLRPNGHNKIFSKEFKRAFWPIFRFISDRNDAKSGSTIDNNHNFASNPYLFAYLSALFNRSRVSIIYLFGSPNEKRHKIRIFSIYLKVFVEK